ncbi:hypothetical protein BDR05DRAFT_896098, partial [Suillus weaverae]
MLVYKPVAKKVYTMPTTTPPKYRVMCERAPEPLVGLPDISSHPPDFIPGMHFTQACMDKIDLDPMNWLWPEELKLICWLVCIHELVLYNTSEYGCLNERYFLPYKIPTVLHAPWSQCNIPILPSMIGEVTCIIKEKILSGIYEPSMAAYHSHWFCIIKKDGKLLCLVYDLQPLNVVTI